VQQREFARGGDFLTAGGADTQVQGAQRFPHKLLGLCEWGLVRSGTSAAHSAGGSGLDQGADKRVPKLFPWVAFNYYSKYIEDSCKK